jgi:uncharacterized membrane protein
VTSDPPSGADGPGGEPVGAHGVFGSLSGVDTSRIEAFSDGVFAVAITLLVLGFSIPEGLAPDQVWSALRDQLPQFWSALLSFAVIGLYWAGHHGTFRIIARASPLLVVVNLAHLATIMFIPFPTLVMAEYGDTFAGTALYAGTIATAGLTGAALLVVALRQNLVWEGTDRAHQWRRAAGIFSITVVFGASIPVAWWSTTAANVMWTALLLRGPVFALLARRRAKHATGTVPSLPQG